MMSDEISEPSSPESSFDANDLYSNAVSDDVTAQLAAAGKGSFQGLRYLIWGI
jgi:hypothetical protein